MWVSLQMVPLAPGKPLKTAALIDCLAMTLWDPDLKLTRFLTYWNCEIKILLFWTTRFGGNLLCSNKIANTKAWVLTTWWSHLAAHKVDLLKQSELSTHFWKFLRQGELTFQEKCQMEGGTNRKMFLGRVHWDWSERANWLLRSPEIPLVRLGCEAFSVPPFCYCSCSATWGCS